MVEFLSAFMYDVFTIRKEKQCAFTERKSVVFNTLYSPENSITTNQKKPKQNKTIAGQQRQSLNRLNEIKRGGQYLIWCCSPVGIG